MDSGLVALIICFSVFVLTAAIVGLTAIKRCPPNKIMVITGRVGTNKDGTPRSAKCIHGGVQFVVPLLQRHRFLDLSPIPVYAELKNALSRHKSHIEISGRFTVGISTEPQVMIRAAECLINLAMPEIQEIAKDIIYGQLRLAIAATEIEEIESNFDKFLETLAYNVEKEIKKIGLRLININITNIKDESR